MCGSLGARLKTGCQSNFRPRGKTGTEPRTDVVDGNNLLALTAETPLEEKSCVVTRKEPPPRTHVSSDDMCSESSESRKTDALSGVHVVVAKESDVTERMIDTGGEQIQGNETRNFRDQGPKIGEKGGGGGKLDSTSSLRLDKDPR